MKELETLDMFTLNYYQNFFHVKSRNRRDPLRDQTENGHHVAVGNISI